MTPTNDNKRAVRHTFLQHCWHALYNSKVHRKIIRRLIANVNIQHLFLTCMRHFYIYNIRMKNLWLVCWNWRNLGEGKTILEWCCMYEHVTSLLWSDYFFSWILVFVSFYCVGFRVSVDNESLVSMFGMWSTVCDSKVGKDHQ